MNTTLRKLFGLSIVWALFGCQPNHPATYVHVTKHTQHVTPIARVHGFHQQVDGVDVYWYLMAISSSDSDPYYYYQSPTPITNFSSVTFTRITGPLPEEVQEGIANSEQLAPQTLEPAQEPANVEADAVQMAAQQDAMTNEGGPAPTESSSSSTDSGSSGGDSGGGDGGGGSGGCAGI